MQTSLKRLGFQFSTRQDMSAKFPRGGGSKLILSHPSNSVNFIFLSFGAMYSIIFTVELWNNKLKGVIDAA